MKRMIALVLTTCLLILLSACASSDQNRSAAPEVEPATETRTAPEVEPATETQTAPAETTALAPADEPVPAAEVSPADSRVATPGLNLCQLGDTLYYVSKDTTEMGGQYSGLPYGLCRMNIDGSGRVFLKNAQEYADFFKEIRPDAPAYEIRCAEFVMDNRIYLLCVTTDEYGSRDYIETMLCSVDPEGSDIRLESDEALLAYCDINSVYTPPSDGAWVYSVEREPGVVTGNIVRIKPDGTGEEVLAEGKYNGLSSEIVDGALYATCTSESDENMSILRRIDTATGETQNIVEQAGKIWGFLFRDGMLYINFDWALYRTNPDGTAITRLGNNIVKWWDFIGGTIFYTTGYSYDDAVADVPLLHRMDLDGGNDIAIDVAEK